MGPLPTLALSVQGPRRRGDAGGARGVSSGLGDPICEMRRGARAERVAGPAKFSGACRGPAWRGSSPGAPRACVARAHERRGGAAPRRGGAGARARPAQAAAEQRAAAAAPPTPVGPAARPVLRGPPPAAEPAAPVSGLSRDPAGWALGRGRGRGGRAAGPPPAPGPRAVRVPARRAPRAPRAGAGECARPRSGHVWTRESECSVSAAVRPRVRVHPPPPPRAVPAGVCVGASGGAGACAHGSARLGWLGGNGGGGERGWTWLPLIHLLSVYYVPGAPAEISFL